MSNGDKRSVSTDALDTLGTIIGEGCGRDAIHLAVEPVVAGTLLWPGQHIGLTNGKATAKPGTKLLGIVDPFLTDAIEEGQKFWLVVYPRQITSLRHVWAHPDFPEENQSVTTEPVNRKPNADEVDRSEKWLIDWCNNNDCPPWADIKAAINGDSAAGSSDDYYSIRIKDGYIYVGGSDAHGSIPEEFWDHAEIVMGRELPFERRAKHFSCSC